MHRFQILLAVVLGIFGTACLTQAQVPSLPPAPYNVPLETPGAATPTVVDVITNTQAPAGTVNTNVLNNLAYNGIDCHFNQVQESGSPDSTISLEAYDAAAQSWRTLVTSPSAKANSSTGVGFTVYPGIQTSGNPVGYSFMNYRVGRWLRIKQVITGANTWVTGTVYCEFLK